MLMFVIKWTSKVAAVRKADTAGTTAGTTLLVRMFSVITERPEEYPAMMESPLM